jgi:hypothetical protein
VAYAGNGNHSEMFLPENYADGGACIQAAINSLGAKAGTIWISPIGPDTATLPEGEIRSGVWGVSSDITATVGSTEITSTAAGAFNEEAGCTLVATDSSVSAMIGLSGTFLSKVSDLYLECNNNADYGIKRGVSGTELFELTAKRVNIQHSNSAAVYLLNANNVSVTRCFLERNNGDAIKIETVSGNRVRNFYFNRNIIDKCRNFIRFSGPSDIEHWNIYNNYLRGAEQHGIYQTGDGNTLRGGFIRGLRINGASSASTGTYDIIRFDGGHFLYADSIIATGADNAAYGVNNQGTLNGGGYEKLTAVQITNSEFNNVPSANIGFNP